MDEHLQRRMERIMSARYEPDLNTDDEVEPKLVDGSGPQGVPDDKGRGELTPRQKARLEALRGFWLRDYMD
jgi:hypothetical protein